MRVKILGKYWNLRFVPNMGDKNGECDAPQTARREIRIQAGLRGQALIAAIIHEALHAGNWHLDEEFVTEFSEDASRLLRHKSIWERIDGE